MITFKKINIEGFGSIIEPLEYPLDTNGLSCIIGKNGSGKTTIFSALCWVLYNKTVKSKPEPWKNIKPKDFKGTKVELTFYKFNVEYRIIHCNNYKGILEDGVKGNSRALLFINGEYVNHLRDKDDVKKEIASIIGMSFELFKNSIFFGQKLKRIIQETGPQKKAIFEEAFEASFIQEAKERAEVKFSTYRSRLSELESNYELYLDKVENLTEVIDLSKRQITSYKKTIDSLKKAQDSLKIKSKNRAAVNKRILNYQASAKRIALKLKEKDNIDNTIFDLSMKLKAYKTEVNMGSSSLLEIQNRLNKVKHYCRLCGQRLDSLALAKSKESLRLEYRKKKKEIEKAKALIGVYQSRIDFQKQKLLPFKTIDKQLRNRRGKEAKWKRILDRFDTYDNYQKEIEKLEKKCQYDDNTQVQLKLDKFKKLLKQLETDKSKIEKWANIYKWILDKPLSNSGIKAYIFKELLNKVNYRLDYYSKFLGFRIEFGIDLDSALKNFYAVCYRGNSLVAYEDLSGGQQQLVDIAIAFSIHDVVNDNHKSNLLIMDEVFESLDEDNIEIVSDLIMEKAKYKSIHLITHRSSFNTATAKTLKLKLDKAGRTIAVGS